MAGSATILTELAKRKSPHGRVMAVSMMKDEAAYLLEWVAHHLAVGFTDILVYTNDCSDGTVEMLQRLEELGLCYHRENVIPEGHKPQPSALNHAQAEPLVQSADWVLVFDADEFLAISHPSGTLDGMITDAVNRGANGIVITWRIFGSGGVVDWSRAPVTEQYLRAAPPLWNKGWGVKTLFKFDPDYWKLGIHRPSIKNKWLETDFPDTVKWLNGSGLPMEDYFKFRGWRSIRRTLGYDWAQMNHYAVKSVDAYAIRKFRGNVNNKKAKYDLAYFTIFDRNEQADEGLVKHGPALRAKLAEFLSDPILAQLYHDSLAFHEARLATLKSNPGYKQIIASLRAAHETPYSALSSVLFTQPLPPVAKDMVAQLRAGGHSDREIAQMIAQSPLIAAKEAEIDAADAAFYRELGLTPIRTSPE
ncbi:glycosyltransferase family 2 protein [Roseovarius sp. 10]|uniref:glycosyltransferase family 2 protein n=1 Tax=Roseovarius sp. 10 TaxID=3080563 RepID=UPI002952C4C5|nr:glycosyltransferase family 2 protein [Roseovarius sp. 10]MDV7201342.1 glycosyltransferase family 2 protein [Roseovarius sp. 10]